ncbi:hypothetical protein M409DRAFT_16543 [Zasmidium cellare ATCC 36951]|uniref:O-methyltransferase dimerisation domain-containing protein n=1 Tax=Zasmidium cellare ATCC 36951 TaxID=1080233 RepID=A0A6A6D7W4_ZASCE|nr:uncharacterized protein M409DRAFT_16543 [Zasmidium cellare ATCC 36951]KAF2174279.1 hypothetical protein M409DRAFT_16543 [Zasmidium cellare ATCC 36951]
MAGALSPTDAESLRGLVAGVSEAVEARIRGEESAGEQVRRVTQAVQIAGMGAPEYWLSQLLQPLKSVCISMAQEMKLLPLVKEQGTKCISAEDMAKQTGYDALLISRVMRTLTNVGLCEEAGHNTYRSSQVSQIVASTGGMAGVKVACLSAISGRPKCFC